MDRFIRSVVAESLPRRAQNAWVRDRGRCHLCSRRHRKGDYRVTWEVDHSVARARGGSDQKRNHRMACISCNRRKGTKSNEHARPYIRAKRHAESRALRRILRGL